MRQKFIIILFLLSPIFCIGKVRFYTNYDEAISKAKEQNKKVFIDVTAKWCKPCQDFSRILENETVSQKLDNNFVCLKLDEKYNQAFLSKHDINAFPTLIFMDSKENIILRTLGAPSKKQFINLLNDLEKIEAEIDGKVIELIERKNENDVVEFMKIAINGKSNYFVEKMTLDIIKTSPFYRDVIFKNFGNMLDTALISSIMALKDSTLVQNLKIRDQLALSYLTKMKPIGLSNINMIANRFQDFGFSNVPSLKAYLASYYAYNLNYFNDDKNTDAQKKSFGKNLLFYYPNCHDRELVLQVLQYLCKSQDPDIPFFDRLLPHLQNLLNDLPDEYQIYDIIGVCQYMTGNKAESPKSIAKAHELSAKNSIYYKPAINVIR